MYGYERYIDITPGQVLQKITQEEIFEFVLEQPFSYSHKYLSPFRDDKRPGCRFEERPDGAIVFVDFGERLRNPKKVHRSCFSMVMDKFGVSMNGAVTKICEHFGLTTNLEDYKPITVSKLYKVKDHNGSPETIIKYNAKIPTKSDVKYWSNFLIKIEEIESDNVFCVKSFSIKNEKGYRIITPYSNCYAMDFVDTVKIYQPYNERYKWITNCTENNIGNIDNLPPTGDELIIQKSYKDHRVLRNLSMGLNVIWFQNEGCTPDTYILKNLAERFKLITVFFDADESGILAALRIWEIFNNIRPGCCRIVHMPILIGRPILKDPSAFINKEGRNDLIQVLKHIGINATST